MDGVSRAVGSPAHVRWRGRLVAIRLTLSILGEIEQYILASRKSPLAMYREVESTLQRGAKPIVHDAAMELALKDNVATLEDIQEFISSREGVALVVWINTRDLPRGSFSFEECREWAESLDASGLAEVTLRLLQAGGIDEGSNLDWTYKKEDASGRKGARVPWRKILRESFDEHGILPAGFGDLTLYQLQTLTRDKREVTNKITFSPNAVPEEILRMTPAERLAWKAKASLAGRSYAELYGDE